MKVCILIKRVSHVGVVVSNLDETLKLYERVFRLKPCAVKDAMEGKVRIAFVPVGDGEIELIQPVDPSIPVGRFLQTHGEGIHHIALTTSDMESDINAMKAQGVALDDDKPRMGAHAVRIIFTKPETTGGVAFELCEQG
jgi:methylmalonyl-CoA/ethylmalonyl-CoA epimerase